MPCPLCGDICRCSSDVDPDVDPDVDSAASPRWLADARPEGVTAPPVLETPRAEAPSPRPEVEASEWNERRDTAAEDSPAWRQEVAARLSRYQARRKPRPPRYPSLRLRFEEEESAPIPAPLESQAYPQRTTASHQALALDSFAESTAHVEVPASFSLPLSQIQASQEAAAVTHTGELPQQTALAQTAKIIEFPRSWTPAPAPLDELAEPVFDRDRPRILEAPEVVPQAPALGGITIEPAQQPEFEKRPGIDIPLQSAPLARRVFAAAIDGVIIAAAGVLFGFIFWKLTAIRPPRLQILALAAGISGVFWAAYQYLLLVYSGSTPGLRLARLELARFDGSPASRRLRRWRVLASFLSAASLGMGYAWVFLDEDALCWHDRITHTYLAPKK
jgi:uncharacterized RDD family membrane protein YckC